MDAEIKAELDRIHDEDKRQNKRIDELEKAQNDNRELLITVKELATAQKYTNKKLDKVEIDVEQIKAAPLKRLNDATETARKTAVSVIVTAIVTSLIWLIVNHGGI